MFSRAMWLLDQQTIQAPRGELNNITHTAARRFGAGSISFEMLRYFTEQLPFMVCRSVRTRIRPIAFADVERYLKGALEVEPGSMKLVVLRSPRIER